MEHNCLMKAGIFRAPTEAFTSGKSLHVYFQSEPVAMVVLYRDWCEEVVSALWCENEWRVCYVGNVSFSSREALARPMELDRMVW